VAPKSDSLSYRISSIKQCRRRQLRAVTAAGAVDVGMATNLLLGDDVTSPSHHNCILKPFIHHNGSIKEKRKINVKVKLTKQSKYDNTYHLLKDKVIQ